VGVIFSEWVAQAPASGAIAAAPSMPQRITVSSRFSGRSSIVARTRWGRKRALGRVVDASISPRVEYCSGDDHLPRGFAADGCGARFRRIFADH
jgi:hypothetical protein